MRACDLEHAVCRRNAKLGLEHARSKGVLAEIEAALRRVRPVLPAQKTPGAENARANKNRAANTEAGMALDEAILAYKQHVDGMLPGWQVEMEQDAYRRLRRLQRAELALKKRRGAAAAAFEKEKALRALLADKEHDVELLRIKEQEEHGKRNRERARLEKEARARALERYAAAAARPIPDLVTPLPPTAMRRRLRAQFPDLADDEANQDKRERPLNQAVIAATPQRKSPRQMASPPPTHPYDATRLRPSHDGAQSPAFELSYEWQSVPLGKTLPIQAEQRLNTAKGLGRMARIPRTWNLEVLLAENGRRFEVRVQQNDEIELVSREVSTLAFGETSPLTLSCNGHDLDSRLSVGAYGSMLFTGQVFARRGAPKRPNETTQASHRAPDAQQGGNAPHTPASAQRWDAIAQDLSALLSALRNPSASADLRASKLGLLEPEDDISSADTKRLKSEIRALGRAALDAESVSVDLMLQTLFSLLSVDAVGLLSLSLLGSGSMTTDLDRVSDALYKFHLSCKDGREHVWTMLVDYWQWVIRERLVSREDLATVFVQVLVPPGERVDGICAANIRWIVREFSSQNAPGAAPGRDEKDSALRETEGPTERQFSFDELLGGSPKPSSREQQSGLEVDDVHSESTSELDASLLATDQVQANAPRARRLHLALREFDQDEDEEDEIENEGDDDEEDRSENGRHESTALDQFVAANRPSQTSGILGESADDPDVFSDDEFDF
ncbi:Hypothetical Protein FCC1311_089362 [Hondaea fermentalgiana]|uniref:Uncharacterized protein n=1 Tax=Hondaea fermentalgiana TaxID=2315210 RepID=A0A2R5GWC4_9STRA|nr:Hypothetical Protein FCC1311_089362 [Hondaea fermentalgiana]|eukprot:GBG32711.1 Hypothetical Protein FCC1311_089362 [Hondaea fermentalgiana]